LALADRYISTLGPALTGSDAQTITLLKSDLVAVQKQPELLKQLISDRVTQFTILLADKKSLPALTVASACLVRSVPTDTRTTNLLATAVALLPKPDDAVTLLEYSLLLEPDSTLAMLNLANAYLNANADEKAHVLLEKVITLDPKNCRAYRVLACYWYKKGDNHQVVDCLMKAAALHGGVRLQKSKQNEETTEKNDGAASESPATLDAKTEALKDLVPLSTADEIEQDLPNIAQKIRDHVGKLLDSERMQLPELPQTNLNDTRDYIRNAPIVAEWMKVVTQRQANLMKEKALALQAEMGINPGDSDAVRSEKGKAWEKKQVQESMANTQRILAALQNVPGMSKAQLDKIQQKLKTAALKQGVTLPDAGNSASALPADTPDMTGLVDSGGMYAEQNYADYQRVKGTYGAYFTSYFKDYDAKVAAIVETYQALFEPEKIFNAVRMKAIDDDEERAGGANSEIDHKPFELRRKKEKLRHVRKLNEIGHGCYTQWVNLYMPQYKQKMKPKLEEFWYVTTLYIRNMNNPAIMKREYLQIRQYYWLYAARATGDILGGGNFGYSGESDREIQQLQDEIHAAEAEAEEQKHHFEQQTITATNALPKWLADKLVISIACESISLKITPRNIEFEAYIPGMSGKVDYNFRDNTVTTSTAVTAKINFGVQVGPLEAKLEGEVKMLGSKSTFDLTNGKVREESDGFASGSLKGVFGQGDTDLGKGWSLGGDPESGGAKVRVGGTIKIDPALDNAYSLKIFTQSVGLDKTTTFGAGAK